MKKVSFILFLLLQCFCYANDLDKTFGIGVGYPYFSFKYGVTSKTSIELRGAYNSDILVGGLRLNNFFNPEDKAVFYLSGEADYIMFQSSWVAKENGEGYAFGFFIGNEYFITNNFTLNFDVGPVLIGLSDTSRDISSNGVQWVFNAGLNYYFGENESKTSKKITTKKIKFTEEEKALMSEHFDRGTKFMERGKYEWAINEFKEVLGYDPNHQPSIQKIEKCKQMLPKTTSEEVQPEKEPEPEVISIKGKRE